MALPTRQVIEQCFENLANTLRQVQLNHASQTEKVSLRLFEELQSISMQLNRIVEKLETDDEKENRRRRLGG